MPARPRRRWLPSASNLAEGMVEDRPRVVTFIRGATIGALVGAALAGSALLRRSRRSTGERPEAVGPGRPPEGGTDGERPAHGSPRTGE